MNGSIRCFVALACLFSCTPVSAQKSATTTTLWQRGVSYEIGWQELYTTHGDLIHGFEAGVGFRLSPRFRMGAGAEFSFTRYHDDNEWRLYNLRFLPIYVVEQIDLRKSGNFRPFIQFRQGGTPTTYLREDAGHIGSPYRITETGMYLSGSMGFTQRITERIGVVGEAGWKGFQMSFDPLEVNPHGANFRLSLIFAK